MNLALAWHRAIDLAPLGGTLAALFLVQTSMILIAGLLFARALSGRGAAAQSACYRITLVAALLAPCAAALIGGRLFPRLSIPLPAWQYSTSVANREMPSGAPTPQAAYADEDHAIIHEPLQEQLPNDPRSAERPRSTTPHSIIDSAHATPAPIATRAAEETSWLGRAAVAFLVAWTSVAAILATRLCGAVVSAARLIRGANDAEPVLAARCRQLAAKLNLRAPAVKRSPFVSSACVFGWRQPVLLLAESDVDVGDDVMIHELAHLVRHDCPWKLFARLAAAAFWFQPLLWRLNARMQHSAEEACDDYVVQCGFDRGNYAGRLTQIAQRYVPNALPAAVGIVTFRSALGRRVSRILDPSRQIETKVGRKTRVGLLAAAAAVVMIAGLIDIGRPQPSVAAVPPNAESGPSAKPPAAPPSTPAPTAKKPPAQKENETQFTIRGQVLKPNGQPAAGAKVFALRNYATARVPWRPLATAATGPDGEFELRVVMPSARDGRVGVGLWIAARDEGFGMQWIQWGGRRRADASAKPVLKLVPESPIHGRVVDWNGKPMSGVRVKVLELTAPQDGDDLAPWLEKIKLGERRATRRQRAFTLPAYDEESQPPIVTDQEGRFLLRGIGRERIARVELRGETMAYAQFEVVTRKIEPITFKSERDPPDQVFGSDFLYQASATRPVVGTVRDAATGKPLAGVRIESQRLAGIVTNPHDVLSTQTDARGAYRLVGFPNGTGNGWANENILTVRPNDEQPYFLHHVEVPDAPGNGPVTLDFNLTRGLWITGQVTDKVSGKPVPANVTYFPFLANSFAVKAPDFKNRFVTGVIYNINDTHLTRPDGTFRIVGLPGPGIVAVTALNQSYRKGVGAYDIPGMARDGSFATYRAPANASAKRENALKLINPAEGTESVHCDFVLDPGGTMHIAIVDSAGKPVERCMVLYARDKSGVVQSAAFGSTFEMKGMLPNESRTVWISKPERKIAKILSVSYDDRSPRNLTLTLEPCATVKGRVVDNAGRPRKHLELVARVEGPGISFQLPRSVSSDGDGRFEFSDLPTGCKHFTLFSYDRELLEWTSTPDKVQVSPGKTIDLGTVKLKPRE